VTAEGGQYEHRQETRRTFPAGYVYSRILCIQASTASVALSVNNSFMSSITETR